MRLREVIPMNKKLIAMAVALALGGAAAGVYFAAPGGGAQAASVNSPTTEAGAERPG